MSTPFVIKVPRDKSLLRAAHDFHLKHAGEFLLPRTIDEFDTLAEAGELWVVLSGAEIVGACYVTREKDDEPAEFGGVILRPDHRAQGLASALGIVALAAHAIQDDADVIAHVHRDNSDPIDLLTKRLGFRDTQTPAKISKSDLERKLGHKIEMRADDDGMIRGNTYAFGHGQLREFAERLESKRLARVPVEVENYYFCGAQLSESLRLLRGLAEAK